MKAPGSAPILPRIRSLLLATLLFGMAGTVTELLLIEHWEKWTQPIPLVLLGLGGALGAIVLRVPTRRWVQLFRLVMGLFVVTGALGVFLHYRGNSEFELEARPTVAGLELAWKALTGATPALAPGTMTLFGLLGLLFCYRHPALDRPGTEEE